MEFASTCTVAVFLSMCHNSDFFHRLETFFLFAKATNLYQNSSLYQMFVFASSKRRCFHFSPFKYLIKKFHTRKVYIAIRDKILSLKTHSHFHTKRGEVKANELGEIRARFPDFD
jgi:hypothetical protein